MVSTDNAYTLLEQHFSRILALHEAEGHLHWDTAVAMLDGERDGANKSQLSPPWRMIDDDPQLADWIEQATAQANNLEPWQRAMSAKWYGCIVTRQPSRDLVEALSRSTSFASTLGTARLTSDFDSVRPKLDEVIRLTRESAQARAASFGCTPYEALLDQFEPD